MYSDSAQWFLWRLQLVNDVFSMQVLDLSVDLSAASAAEEWEAAAYCVFS